MTTQHSQVTAWWLEPGPETCPFCEARFHFEATCYCSHCDQPICPACVIEVFASRQVLCPQCHDAGEQD